MHRLLSILMKLLCS